MSAVIATRQEESTQTLPWYRYGWPWFLISIPMVSVCLGSVMLYLAFNANNSLVVDDYYKEGKAYNLRIERDRLASLLGLEAVITQSSEGVIMELGQAIPAQLPPGLELQAQSFAAAYTMLALNGLSVIVAVAGGAAWAWEQARANPTAPRRRRFFIVVGVGGEGYRRLAITSDY